MIGNDSPAYIPSGIDMKLLTPSLKKYHIFRVFAHPAARSFPGESHNKEVLSPIETVEKILPEFLNPQIVGLDGIEVYYPRTGQRTSSAALKMGGKVSLSGDRGSDCHDWDQRSLGINGVTQEELNVFLEKLESPQSRIFHGTLSG